MEKIPTLFKREFEGHDIVRILPEFNDGLGEWVFNLTPTVKIDGSCCALLRNGRFYIRYDAKNGKTPPEGAIPCCPPDPVTGHWPHWLRDDPPVQNGKWQYEAFRNLMRERGGVIVGTYEAIGPHFQGNPYKLERDILVRHDSYTIIKDVPKSFEECKEFLKNNPIEGIVWWSDRPVCKLKRSDFGFEWPCENATYYL